MNVESAANAELRRRRGVRHQLLPKASTMHGVFSRELPPALRIEPGDTVCYRLPDAAWNWPEESLTPLGEGDGEEILPYGHCLVGPVWVNGAKAGQTLAVSIGQMLPESAGWTLAGGWDSAFNERLGIATEPAVRLNWELDAEAMTGTSDLDQVLNLAPFLGVMGVAPAEPGQHSSAVPHRTGGNLDCRELVAGSVLYLPVEVDGALFSCGDGHAAQGDGEICGTAIECAMRSVELTFDLAAGQELPLPWAETPAGTVTMGLDVDLETAAYQAMEQMIRLIERRLRIPRKQAAAVASVSAHLRITQLVNGICGVHALWDATSANG